MPLILSIKQKVKYIVDIILELLVIDIWNPGRWKHSQPDSYFLKIFMSKCEKEILPSCTSVPQEPETYLLLFVCLFDWLIIGEGWMS